jgi:hypothetical protein
MARLLDRATLTDSSGNASFLDADSYADAYLAAVLASVDSEIARYLRWTPWLQQTVGEEGAVTWLDSGPYAGRYLIQLRNKFLIPGTAAQVFDGGGLSLQYALALTVPSTVSLQFITLRHDTGRVFCLAPGTVEAFTPLFFGYAPPLQNLYAVGYQADYWSGFLTGVGDPTPPVGVTVPTLPDDIREAAALLVQEKAIFDAQHRKQMDNPFGAFLLERQVGERRERYGMPQRIGSASLGYGTPMADAARVLLEPWRKVEWAQII